MSLGKSVGMSVGMSVGKSVGKSVAMRLKNMTSPEVNESCMGALTSA